MQIEWAQFFSLCSGIFFPSIDQNFFLTYQIHLSPLFCKIQGKFWVLPNYSYETHALQLRQKSFKSTHIHLAEILARPKVFFCCSMYTLSSCIPRWQQLFLEYTQKGVFDVKSSVVFFTMELATIAIEFLRTQSELKNNSL